MSPNDNPARPTHFASRLDAAFDDSTDAGKAALAAYVESRSIVDLSMVPVRAGMTLTLWKVRPLSAAERAVVLSNRSEAMADLNAVQYGVVARVEGATVLATGLNGGTETVFKRHDASNIVAPEALAAELEIAGGVWVDELGAFIRARSDARPGRYFPFSLPPRVAALL